DALMDALNRDAIAGAALDVAVPEPVPADHPLWDTKNLILTPHISGNMALGYTRDENVRLFCKNLLRYANGDTPSGVVDRARGY
ncbi:MAG: D-2-hydroxyacid dehydrogenase, partial [Oscillibacter sp.]|nr:D-2-hydroxyacid dehydrogenase [Oscillibacter sp.]